MTKQIEMAIKKDLMEDFKEVTSLDQIEVVDETLAIITISDNEKIEIHMDYPPDAFW